jgi:membrane fusion protein (multidrug efflux system)
MLKAIALGLLLLGLVAAGAAYQYPELRGLDALANLQKPGAPPSPGSEPRPSEKTGNAATPAAAGKSGRGKDGGGQPVAVEAANAKPTKTTRDLRAIGSLRSDESVQIASEIAGRIVEMPLQEGMPVKAGDVLVKLDEALARAEVTDTTARYEFAKGNLDRANTLSRTGNVTGRARDEASTNAETAMAAVELAKTRLSKHVIRAPFPGTVGLRVVSPGAYIGVGAPIVNLEKIDTLKVDFKLPELNLSEIKTGQSIEVSVDALPGRTFPGTIYAIDPHVDVNGRSLSIRATLPNPDGTLRPGLFARILVKGLTEREVVVVPESAIVPRGGENVVYAIEDGKAVESKVKLGSRNAGFVEVLDGLKTDASVVTAGQQKLRNGAPVEVIIRNSDAASATGN